MSIFSTIETDFKNALESLWAFITGPKAKAAIESAAALVPLALPIVQDLAAIDPKNTTVAAVEAAYQKYAIPVATQITQDSTSIGNALLNLASQVLAKNLSGSGQAAPATNILNSAVQLAVTAIKAI